MPDSEGVASSTEPSVRQCAIKMTLEEIKRGFGQRLKLLRKMMGFRFTKDFADFLGLGREAVYKYEQGARKPEPDDVYVIKQRTKATYDWLAYDDWDTLPTTLHRDLQAYLEKQGEHANGDRQ